MDNELKELLQEQIKLQKKLNRKATFSVVLITFVSVAIICLQFFTFNKMKDIDVDSLNNTLKNIETITDAIAEEELDVNSLNNLISNLSELSTKVTELTEAIETKLDTVNDFKEATKDKLEDALDSIFNGQFKSEGPNNGNVPAPTQPENPKIEMQSEENFFDKIAEDLSKVGEEIKVPEEDLNLTIEKN
jgi:predicted DNA-binding protein